MLTSSTGHSTPPPGSAPLTLAAARSRRIRCETTFRSRSRGRVSRSSCGRRGNPRRRAANRRSTGRARLGALWPPCPFHGSIRPPACAAALRLIETDPTSGSPPHKNPRRPPSPPCCWPTPPPRPRPSPASQKRSGRASTASRMPRRAPARSRASCRSNPLRSSGALSARATSRSSPPRPRRSRRRTGWSSSKRATWCPGRGALFRATNPRRQIAHTHPPRS